MNTNFVDVHTYMYGDVHSTVYIKVMYTVLYIHGNVCTHIQCMRMMYKFLHVRYAHIHVVVLSHFLPWSFDAFHLLYSFRYLVCVGWDKQLNVFQVLYCDSSYAL